MFASGASGSGGGGGSGVERSRASRGAALPFLDSVPLPPPPGPPVFTSYAGRQNVAGASVYGEGNNDAADDRDTDDDGSGTRFREDDRMLLRLLYHQQQAIQVQLNTMTEWMQQVNYRIAAVERTMRTSRSTVNTAAGPRSSSAQPPSPGTSATEGYAPGPSPHLVSHPWPTLNSEQAPADVSRGHLSGQGSTYSGQSHFASSAPAVSSVLEGSRACTPPSEQTRHHISGGGGAAGGSGVPSTTRSSESALAAPWDPHNTSQQLIGGAVHSRTSSHTSALGRRANPLLNSSGVKSRLQMPAAASRSSLADSRPQLSRLETSGLSATGGQASAVGVTGAVSEAAPAPAQPRQPPVVSPPTTASLTTADAVPPYRRVSAESAAATTMTRQPLSRLSAIPRHAPPTSTLADVADSRSGREGTLPPPPPSTATSSLQDNTQNRSAAVDQGAHEHTKEAASAPPAGLPAAHADPAGSRGSERGAFRGRAGTQGRVAADDDSLSDGYGSYESRMYMKSLGLL
ncbi:hypothetical protein ABB37_04952 [Leptomonas pyrrhocoris]|uniref:Uncharacterized protein n=1 Tax=Leptomonas pyrrhocoris TaxID=157538 RepID=A0A0M9G0G3_LEPPY|nr:hypothetical protein ABB37_04952 [Leptomonas pyrrhocoris]KPA79880.1 hypothetical protein ABB37_04952 [Leptomonas pyrrhocoris]|eukprot:XP_015658319.1 hypothetical protein ABB37_04952 [Leptomonas pyrrhocoris]